MHFAIIVIFTSQTAVSSAPVNAFNTLEALAAVPSRSNFSKAAGGSNVVPSSVNTNGELPCGVQGVEKKMDNIDGSSMLALKGAVILDDTKQLASLSIATADKLRENCKELVILHNCQMTPSSFLIAQNLVKRALQWEQGVKVRVVLIPGPYNGEESSKIAQEFKNSLSKNQQVKIEFRASVDSKSAINQASSIPSIGAFIPDTIGQDVFGLARFWFVPPCP
jgi:hypothetical protein